MHKDDARSPPPPVGRERSKPDAFDAAPPMRVPVDNETGWLLARGIRAIHLTGDEAERDSAHVIGLLRRDPRAAAEVVEQWIDQSAGDASLRWSLLYLLSEIGDSACRDLLGRQALRRIQEGATARGRCEQESDFDELVSVMAIEGLGRLAKAGDAESVSLLTQVVERQERRSLRQPAVAALLAAGVARANIERVLPERERYLLGLRDANEDDLRVDLAHPAREKKPFRRATGPRPPPTTLRGSAPAGRCCEGGE